MAKVLKLGVIEVSQTHGAAGNFTLLKGLFQL